jgi:hypothetical protein
VLDEEEYFFSFVSCSAYVKVFYLNLIIFYSFD